MSDTIDKKIHQAEISNSEMNKTNQTGSSSKNEPLKLFMHLSDSALANLSVKNMPFETYAPVFYSPVRSVDSINTDEQQSSFCKSNIVSYVIPDAVEANDDYGATTNSVLSEYAEMTPNIITDPRIMVTNLPTGFKESDMKNFCSAFQIQSAANLIAANDGKKSSSYVMVSTENFERAATISSRISGKIYGGNRLHTSALWRLN